MEQIAIGRQWPQRFDGDHSNILRNTLFIPGLVAATSILIFAFSSLFSWLRHSLGLKVTSQTRNSSVDLPTQLGDPATQPEQPLNRVIVAFQVIRVLSSLSLLGLSLYTFFSSSDDEGVDRLLERLQSPQFVLCVTYTYTSLLSLVALSANSQASERASPHLDLILVSTWLVFAYRDIWPLMTYTLTPADANEGTILYLKVVALSIGAILVPGLMPRRYVPVNPEEPMAEPNPEQTASILSSIFYQYMDSIVIQANKVAHLSLDQFPPLSDYDWSKNLMKSAQPRLDPLVTKKRTHLFWKLLSIHRFEFFNMAIMLVIRLVTTLAAPIGINRLLNYLETGGRDAVIQPWVWVLWLFLSPSLTSIVVQWHQFNASRILVRTEAILTQVIFEHALRIRTKTETSKYSSSKKIDGDSRRSSILSATPGDQSQDEDADSQGESATLAEDASASANDSKAQESNKDDKSDNLTGRINNLVTTDLEAVTGGRDLLVVVFYAPVQSILCLWLLYSLLGWSSLVGLAVMIITAPLPGFLTKSIQTYQVKKMETSDARVQSITEVVNVMRMIKLFGWERRVAEQVSEAREQELTFVTKTRIASILMGCLSFLIPLMTMVVTFATYTGIMKQPLTASKVFTATTVFEMLRTYSYDTMAFMMPLLVKAKVSLDRIDDFLWKTELLDQYSVSHDSEDLVTSTDAQSRSEIGIRAAEFSWHNQQLPASDDSEDKFVLRVPDELFFKRGSINVILGPTGSGKTSLLMALLGELHYRPLTPDSVCNLPRDGGVAYAAQESWVLNETIRENILFGSPYDEERYNKVLQQCALTRDLTLFEAGDKTEVGEKGLTLSGGQKARVTLARAVYSSAKIVLLDDVLAALDVHTSRWIVDKCFKGDLLQGRTTILVTHNVALASTIAEFAVHLSKDGKISSQGQLSKILAQDEALASEYVAENKIIEVVEYEEIKEPNSAQLSSASQGKLIVDEEISVGHIAWSSLKLFLTALGGQWPVLFWISFVGMLLCGEMTLALISWFAGYWATQYEQHAPSDVSIAFFLAIYGCIFMSLMIFVCIGYVSFTYGSIRASRAIHRKLIDSVLGATLRWLDITPTARIITRCTQDIATLDGRFAMSFMSIFDVGGAMLVKFTAIMIVSPIFIIPGAIIAFLGFWCGQIYIRAQLPVKREMSNARAPVLGHLGAAISGLASIRAYGAQDAFKSESMKRIDTYARAARTFTGLNLWINVRIETISGLFSSSLAAYMLYSRGTGASNTGFALDMAVTFSAMVLWLVRILNDFEISGNSMERIAQYTAIEQEPKPFEGGVPPAYWPASGELRVENLSARYSEDGPKVLQDLSFHIKSGERVGIVGRTGSGKSTLTLSLLRCLYTEGKVYYDGIPVDSINLDALRSSITIIPQVPELMSGTLRKNLDPLEEHDDAVLNDALRSAGLFSLHEGESNGRLNLDSKIAGSGSNLSVGQRQILALARAMVRRSKLLILDEATSAIDYDTDAIIQTSLRKELSKDVSLLIVAHRLQTIMDADKIIVLDAGRIVEFGKPNELLQNSKGLLRALVDESPDKEKLYAMAVGEL